MNRRQPRITAAFAPWQLFDAVVWTAALMFLVVLGVHEAHAGEHRYPNADPAWQAECGGCHVAYPPALLPAGGWNVVLDRLDRHYGVDASLDPTTVRRLRDYAIPASGQRPRVVAVADGDLPRISTLPWFVKEHRKVAQARPASVKSMSDCAACHTAAAQGDFAESNLRIPR
jgi:cytochrome c553